MKINSALLFLIILTILAIFTVKIYKSTESINTILPISDVPALIPSAKVTVNLLNDPFEAERETVERRRDSIAIVFS
jgi:hypothetical protein